MPTETVILVHGLWMNGMEMQVLQHRLHEAGYRPQRFSYSTMKQSPPESAHDLQDYLRTVPGETVHFVCHSLGGLVVRHLFHRYPDRRPGRVVTLGTPHRACAAAAKLSATGLGRRMLGRSIDRGLLGNLPPWPPARELGSIAGDLRFGLGLIIPGIPTPSDGTVAVEETKLDGMTDHVIVNASHFGLLFSRRAEQYVERFLETGSFGED